MSDDKKIKHIYLSLVVGAFISLLPFYAQQKISNYYERKKIAKAFLIEISSLEIDLENYNRAFSNKSQSALVKDIPSDVWRPFYPSNGLFFQLQKEIFRFDSNLSEELFQFYNDLLEAESARNILFENYNLVVSGPDIGSPDIEKIWGEMFKMLNNKMKKSEVAASKRIPELKMRLMQY
ncbi:MAG: hypothetical protein ABII74_00450 [Elusimicrobiota bacterium]